MDNTTSTVIVAELEATPPRSKDAATSTEPKDDVKVMVVGSTEHEGLKLLSGTQKSGVNTQILETGQNEEPSGSSQSPIIALSPGIRGYPAS